MPSLLTWTLALWSLMLPYVSAQCNPVKETCPPNPGLTASEYYVDFTQQSSLPEGWILANYASVTYGPNGAEFSFTKRRDAPYIWTNFYILFGRVDVVMQAAPGTGIVSSAVLLSDTQDEIDWEWSGNNFGDGQSSGKVQTNYFGKGITGNYDRGTLPPVASPQTTFHTYSLDWTPTALTWSIDGTVVRTLNAADTDNADHQYPQAPSNFHLGLWNAGDPDNSPGTIQWAGGSDLDLSRAPFTAYVKSVRITNMTPCAEYEYTDMSGNRPSIKCVNGTMGMDGDGSSSSAPTSSSPTATATPSPPGMPSSTVTRGPDNALTEVEYVTATDC